jgi:alcohol dehydrogenase, propanol-preferring
VGAAQGVAEGDDVCRGLLDCGRPRVSNYGEHLTVPAAFAHPLPAGYSDAEFAPLLCAGIIGYRRCGVPPPGRRLGLYGFGGSEHLAAQAALAQGATLYMMTRDEKAPELARSPGAWFVGGAADMPPRESSPERCNRARDFHLT